MKVQARSKYLKISARKLRLSADLVRGMKVVDAGDLLRVTNKKSAVLVSDTLRSAVANAENNLNLAKRNLSIDEIRVDEGPMLKRIRPRARGSASPIMHRMAHLTIILTDEAKPTQIKSVSVDKKTTKATGEQSTKAKTTAKKVKSTVKEAK